MKEGIHPKYTAATITCACGNVIETNSTKESIKVDVCSKCHPFWTGNLRKDTTGVYNKVKLPMSVRLRSNLYMWRSHFSYIVVNFSWKEKFMY